jgi:hypothetical protein
MKRWVNLLEPREVAGAHLGDAAQPGLEQGRQIAAFVSEAEVLLFEVGHDHSDLAIGFSEGGFDFVHRPGFMSRVT